MAYLYIAFTILLTVYGQLIIKWQVGIYGYLLASPLRPLKPGHPSAEALNNLRIRCRLWRIAMLDGSNQQTADQPSLPLHGNQLLSGCVVCRPAIP